MQAKVRYIPSFRDLNSRHPIAELVKSLNGLDVAPHENWSLLSES